MVAKSVKAAVKKSRTATPKTTPPPLTLEDPSFLLFLRANGIDPTNPDNEARVAYAKDRQQWESEYSLLQYVTANGGLDLDPLSDDALEFQAKYAAVSGSHPLDVLLQIARNPFCDTKDRISAAKGSLEYVARKIPSSLDLGVKGNIPLQVDMSQLRNLSDKELSALQTLLAKAAKT